VTRLIKNTEFLQFTEGSVFSQMMNWVDLVFQTDKGALKKYQNMPMLVD
jgi:hypothetical protein